MQGGGPERLGEVPPLASGGESGGGDVKAEPEGCGVLGTKESPRGAKAWGPRSRWESGSCAESSSVTKMSYLHRRLRVRGAGGGGHVEAGEG